MNTISELNNTIEIMRKAYSFKDDESYISLETNLLNHRYEVVNISTIDKATGTEVMLRRDIEKMENKNETHR
jgi:hypothetical protein